MDPPDSEFIPGTRYKRDEALFSGEVQVHVLSEPNAAKFVQTTAILRCVK